MNAFCLRAAFLGLIVGCLHTAGSGWCDQPASHHNPFFAYCVGIGVEPSAATLPAQMQLAPMLAELGYDGMALVNLDGAERLMAELEKHHQKLIAVYTALSVDPRDKGYDPRLNDLIPKLAGHDTVVWLTVNSREHKPSTVEGDARAVELLQKLSATAKPHGVKISLYPHLGCYAQRMEDVVRLAKKVDRPNVGVTFTFCHFLALDDAKNMDHAIELARPYLNMVTINGTDGYNAANRAGWIKTLDQGTFDVGRVVSLLRKIDYRGPIGIIAYGIRGDRREILERSMKGWKKLSGNAADTKFTDTPKIKSR